MASLLSPFPLQTPGPGRPPGGNEIIISCNLTCGWEILALPRRDGPVPSAPLPYAPQKPLANEGTVLATPVGVFS